MRQPSGNYQSPNPQGRRKHQRTGGGGAFARTLLDKIGCLKIKWENLDVELPQLIDNLGTSKA